MKFRLSARLLILLPCLFFVTAVAFAAGMAQAQAPDPSYDEAQAQSIDRMLMCPVCPAENIEQAQVELARQMRRLVREMLAEGATQGEILDFFVERYGPGVLAAPPKSGFNLVAWIFPAVAVVAALAAGFLVLRSMAARRGPQPATDPPLEEELEPYLVAVDQEMVRLELVEGGRSETAGGKPAEPPVQQAHDVPDSPPGDLKLRRKGGPGIDG